MWFFVNQSAHGCVETDVPVDIKVLRDALKVGLYIVSIGVSVGPIRFQRETEAIPSGRNVAGQAWIGILAPGATYAAGFFIDGDVAVPRLI